MSKRSDFFDLDEHIKDIPEAVIGMIDALRDYIPLLESIADDSYSSEGEDLVPLPKDNPIWGEIAQYKNMLSGLENNWGVDPTLQGLIKVKR